MDIPDKTDFYLRAGFLLAEELRVLSFVGDEELSAPYRFQIEVLCDLDPAGLHISALGHPAIMSWRLNPEASDLLGAVLDESILDPRGLARRNIHGVIESITVLGDSVQAGTHYRLELVPRLALLRKRTSSRIFQKKTVRQIVDSIFREHGVTASWDAGTTGLKKRDYCVQYRETDFDFVTRILSEEGILYYFEQATFDVSVVPSLVAEASSKLSTAVVASELDALASWSPLQAVSHETVVLTTEASYQSLGATMTTGVGGGLNLSGTGTIQSVGGAVAAKLGISGADAPSVRPAIPYRPASGMLATCEAIHTFAWKRAILPESAAYRETQVVDATTATGQSPARPSRAHFARMLAGMARSVAPDLDLSLIPQPPVGDAMQRLLAERVLQLPEPLTQEYGHGESLSLVNASRQAKLIHEAHKVRAIGAQGTGTCRRMSPGYAFSLSDYPVLDLNANYVLTRVRHKGSTNFFAQADGAEPITSYQNDFECTPDFLVVRPMPIPARMQQVLETATVVGLQGHAPDEPYSQDPGGAGQVLVRFHWDRDAERDRLEHPTTTSSSAGQSAQDSPSSCWIPVAHGWAARAYGFQFVPRVGMEVIVGFLDGSASQPIILGAVHHRLAPPPFSLPGAITQSGIRTQSIGASSNIEGHTKTYNQLLFEDRSGGEFAELYSCGDTRITADGDGHLYAGGELHVTSSIFDQKTLGPQRVRVEDDRQLTVLGNEWRTHEQSVRSVIGGDYSGQVAGGYALDIGGASEVTIHGPARKLVKGALSLEACEDVHTHIERHLDAEVRGDIMVRGHEAMDVTVLDGIRFVCGQSSIELSPNGIHIRSHSIAIEGSSDVLVSGAGSTLQLEEDLLRLHSSEQAEVMSKHIALHGKNGTLDLDPEGSVLAAKDKLELVGKSASVILTDKARIDGDKVSLKSGSSGEGSFENDWQWEDKDETSYVLGAQLMSPGGEPLAHEEVMVVDPDTQRTIAGPIETDEDGRIRVRVPVGPDGKAKAYDIHLVQQETPSIRGVDDRVHQAVVAATFVRHDRTPLDFEPVLIEGADFEEEAETDEHGAIEVRVPGGEYLLTVAEREFVVVATDTSPSPNPGATHIFVVEPLYSEDDHDSDRDDREPKAQSDSDAEEDVP